MGIEQLESFVMALHVSIKRVKFYIPIILSTVYMIWNYMCDTRI